MIFEKSCGAVVYAVKDGRRLYLVERMVKGHTSICKGHVEGDETEHETAAREIREETGLSVEFIDGFSRAIRYSPYEGCLKDVIFFLAKAGSTQTTAQPEEVEAIDWLELPDALTALTHRTDRETLLSADRYLNDHPETRTLRPMRRHERQVDRERCEEILKGGFDGVLSLYGDEGWPYGVPLSYVYQNGKIYFHGAKAGQKLDAVRRDPRVSFCVVTRDIVDLKRYTTHYQSAIAFGTVREVTEETEKRAALRALALEYVPADTPEHREKIIDAEFDATTVLELDIAQMTGKENG